MDVIHSLVPRCRHKQIMRPVCSFVYAAGEPLRSQLLFLEFIRCLWERQVVHTGLPSIAHQQYTHNLCLQPPLQLCCPHDL